MKKNFKYIIYILLILFVGFVLFFVYRINKVERLINVTEEKYKMDIKNTTNKEVFPFFDISANTASKENKDYLYKNYLNLNYDFNFENQVENNDEPVVAPPPEAPKLVKDEVDPNAVADPAIGKVNPNPVKPENVVPVDVDLAAGVEAKVEEEEKAPTITADNIKTSGTATAEEIEIDATTQSAELLDEYAIKMDAATAKKQEKRNIIFIVVVFAILFLFVLFLRPLIKMIGI